MSDADLAQGRVLEDIAISLGIIPSDRPVALLLRHGDRDNVTLAELVEDIPITGVGVKRSRSVGALLGNRLASLHSSPLDRCVQTGVALREGASLDVPIALSTLLGAPGCFVSQGDKAGSSFSSMGLDAVFLAQLTGEAPPGFRDTAEGACRLMSAILPPDTSLGVHVWITHDSVLGVFLGHFLRWKSLSAFPAYLEGAWLWEDKGHLMFFYRRRLYQIEPDWALE